MSSNVDFGHRELFLAVRVSSICLIAIRNAYLERVSVLSTLRHFVLDPLFFRGAKLDHLFPKS